MNWRTILALISVLCVSGCASRRERAEDTFGGVGYSSDSGMPGSASGTWIRLMDNKEVLAKLYTHAGNGYVLARIEVLGSGGRRWVDHLRFWVDGRVEDAGKEEVDLLETICSDRQGD